MDDIEERRSWQRRMWAATALTALYVSLAISGFVEDVQRFFRLRQIPDPRQQLLADDGGYAMGLLRFVVLLLLVAALIVAIAPGVPFLDQAGWRIRFSGRRKAYAAGLGAVLLAVAYLGTAWMPNASTVALRGARSAVELSLIEAVGAAVVMAFAWLVRNETLERLTADPSAVL
jgi:MFS family permease